MTENPRIEVDEKKIIRVAWKSVGFLGFHLVPEGSPGPSAADVDRAITGLRIAEFPDMPLRAVDVVNGVAIFTGPFLGSTHQPVDMAHQIAELIAPLGFEGSITACADTLGRRPRKRESFCAVMCSSAAAMNNTSPPLFEMPLKKNWDRWDTSSPEFTALVHNVSAWVTAHSPKKVVAGQPLSQAQCAPHQVARILSAVCRDTGFADVKFATNAGDRYAMFNMEGWLIVGTEIKSEDDTGEEVVRILSEWAPLYDFGFISRVLFGLPSTANQMAQGLFERPRDGDLSKDHEEFTKRTLPGIFPLQVLGPEHPDLQPADRWEVAPLAAGRRLVTLDQHQKWLKDRHYPEAELRALREANAPLLGKWS
ncbi:hypothetical protein [Arthrobacter horti]|nr:hypothetical protein [Arthrobacter sp. YJM1]